MIISVDTESRFDIVESKSMKLLKIHPIKYIQGLYSEKYKTSMRKIKEVHVNGKRCHVYGL